MYNNARRAQTTTLLQVFTDETELRRHICGWVRVHLEEKVVEIDLVDRIMMDIKWSAVLDQIREIVNDVPLSDSESDEEPPVRVPRRQVQSTQN